jgi:hypothetical protein
MTLQIFKADNIEDKVSVAMSKLAVGHHKRGVLSHQYAIVGGVLIKAFQKCIGEEYVCRITEVWSKMFSMMLKVLVPAAFKIEATEGCVDVPDLPNTQLCSPTVNISSSAERKLKENEESHRPLLDGLSTTKKLIVCKQLEKQQSLNRNKSQTVIVEHEESVHAVVDHAADTSSCGQLNVEMSLKN